MGLYIGYVAFFLIILGPLTVYTLVKPALPKAKKAKWKNLNQESIVEFKENRTYHAATETEIQMIRRRLQDNITIPTITITMDVIALFAGLGLLRTGAVKLPMIIYALLGFAVLSFLCVYFGIRKGRAFEISGNFCITQGLILKNKKRFIKIPNTWERIEVHDLVFLAYGRNGEMIVAKDTVRRKEFLKLPIGEAEWEFCPVVLHDDQVITTI